MMNLNDRVSKAEPDLASCDHKICDELGQYIRCYFDYKYCPKYLEYKENENLDN